MEERNESEYTGGEKPVLKANELRIGNLVSKDGNVFEADFITIHMAHNYEPIPLTEEWLVKFGFISDPYQDMYIKGWLKINCDKTRGKLELWVDNIKGRVAYFDSVHQLQNLYFAITEEELTIKHK